MGLSYLSALLYVTRSLYNQDNQAHSIMVFFHMVDDERDVLEFVNERHDKILF